MRKTARSPKIEARPQKQSKLRELVEERKRTPVGEATKAIDARIAKLLR